MKTCKVSIIVPVYHLAEYLRRCLDSCVYQTLQEIEIIVVNDCSPDEQDSIIMKEYAQRFPDKIRTIWHDENQRQGGARNTGILAARGEFLQFVDGDDYIDLRMTETMYKAAKSAQAEMAMCNRNWLVNGKMIHLDTFSKVDSDNKMGRLLAGDIHFAGRVILKREVLLKHKLLFPKKIYYEDFFCCLWHIAVNKIAYVEEPLYFYVQRVASTTTIRGNEIQYERRKDLLKCIEYTFESDYFKSISKELKGAVFAYLFNHFFIWCFQSVLNEMPSRLQEWCVQILEVQRHSHIDLDDKMFDKNDRIRSIKDLFAFIENYINEPNFLEMTAHYFETARYEKIIASVPLNKRVIIWGAGERGRRLAKYLARLKYQFEITDIDSERVGESFEGKVIKSWNELRENADMVIVAAAGIYDEVAAVIHDPMIELIDFREFS